jgi:hypothetical protein
MMNSQNERGNKLCFPRERSYDSGAGRTMSSTVFKEKGYRFFFFSREEKRIHVHILSGDGEAKF